MAITVQSVVDEVRNRFPEISQALALGYVNDANRKILENLPEIRRTTTTISVNSGTSEYTLADTVFQVDLATFTPAGGSVVTLSGTTIEQLNQSSKTWRTDAQGTPNEYYISASSSANIIGLYPNPSANGSLKCYGSEIGSDLLIGDNLYAPIPDKDAHVDGACYYAAKTYRALSAAWYAGEFKSSMAGLVSYIRSKMDDEKTQAVENTRGGGYPVNRPKGAK